jgi:hypothetical protein
MTEVTPSKEDLKKAMEELDLAVEEARKFRLENEAFLRVTKAMRERRRARLRRAGLLRD